MANYNADGSITGLAPNQMVFGNVQPRVQPVYVGNSGFGNGFGGLDLNSIAALAAMFAPKTSQQMTGEINDANTMLPSDLQESAAQIDPNAVAQASNMYQQTVVAPQLAQIRANEAAQGRDNSTFGGAEVGQAEATGAQNAYYAGQDLIDRSLQRWASKRQSYLGMPVTAQTGGTTAASFLPSYMSALGNLQDAALKAKQYQQGSRYALAQGLFGAVPYAAAGLQGAYNWAKNKFGGGGNALGLSNNGGYSATDPAQSFGAGFGGTYSNQPFGPNSFAGME